MTATVRVIERVVRRAPFGLRVWDVAVTTDLVDGLEIDISVLGDPRSKVRAHVTRSGVYAASGLPGLRSFELGAGDDSVAWSAPQRHYRVEIRDPQGRFIPIDFEADLPACGLFTWPVPGTSPPQAYVLPTEQGSPPTAMIGRVPLFSAPSRTAPASLATVRAHLRELGGDRPAAHALLAVSIDGMICGIGMADEQGRVAVLFPYPGRPRPSLTSPPQPTNDFRWDATLTAYYLPAPAALPVPALADLAAVVAQTGFPRTLFASTTSPPQPLPAQPLRYGVPLTVRTETTDTGPSSYLFLNTA